MALNGIHRRTGQLESIAGAREARGISLEIFNACRAGVDLRHPYRDRRLVEFMLTVGSHQLYRRGRFKHLARAAAENLLPAEILTREKPTLLTPLFNRGLRDRETAKVREILGVADAVWPRYVDRDWLSDVLRDGPKRVIDDVVLWHCVGFEFWLRRHHRGFQDTTINAPLAAMREKTA